jgi:peptide chain release factor 1
MSDLLERLKIYDDNYRKLAEKLSSPEVSSNPDKIKEYGKKIAEIEEIVNIGRKYGKVISSIKDAEDMLKIEKEEEMRNFLKD